MRWIFSGDSTSKGRNLETWRIRDRLVRERLVCTRCSTRCYDKLTYRFIAPRDQYESLSWHRVTRRVHIKCSLRIIQKSKTLDIVLISIIQKSVEISVMRIVRLSEHFWSNSMYSQSHQANRWLLVGWRRPSASCLATNYFVHLPIEPFAIRCSMRNAMFFRPGFRSFPCMPPNLFFVEDKKLSKEKYGYRLQNEAKTTSPCVRFNYC